MNILKKMVEYIAPTTSEMFGEYVKYFNDVGMTFKVGRGAICVTHNGVTKEYTSWILSQFKQRSNMTAISKNNWRTHKDSQN